MDEMDGLQILKNRPLPIKPHEFFIGEGRFCMYLCVLVCTCMYLYVLVCMRREDQFCLASRSRISLSSSVSVGTAGAAASLAALRSRILFMGSTMQK